VAAAGAAERVFGYAEAAAHWRRAIELSGTLPHVTKAAGADLPGLYLRLIDDLDLSGDRVEAGRVAEEACLLVAALPDRVTAAAVHHRAAHYRGMDAPGAGLPLMKEALRLFEQTPPSLECALAWFEYADMEFADGAHDAFLPAVHRALEIAEAAGATTLIPRILAVLAAPAFVRGQVGEGFAILQRGWTLAQASADGPAHVWLAVNESDALLKLARFQGAADVALRVLRPPGRLVWRPGTGSPSWLAMPPKRCWPWAARLRPRR
jgi:hypothetical protein